MSSYQYNELKKQLKALLEKGHYEEADGLLKAGLMDASKTNEMLVWIALFALKQLRPKRAQAALACLTLRDNTHQPLQLLSQALSGSTESSLAVAREAYRTAPLEKSTLALYLNALKQSGEAQHKEKVEQILSWYLADFQNATDLIGKVEHLTDLGYQQIAIARREQSTFKGWVLRSKANTPPPVLLIITNNTKVTRYEPKRRLSILAEHDLWQFEISFKGLDLNTTNIDLRFENETQLRSKIYTVGAHSVPRQTASAGAHSAPQPNTIDVIIPVYAGFDTTLACINSVLTSVPQNQTPLNILVVNDATPDADLADALTTMANNQHIELLTNTENLGFIGAVNRALALHTERNVVLLNSDTLVHGNWLDRLYTVATHTKANHQAPVASVTPYTNNGELMSLLGPNTSAPALQPDQLSALDQVAKKVNADHHSWLTIDAPCGFCMFMNRVALEQQGYLDTTLKRGYGEESDWAYRTAAAGWQHLGATNTVVAHQGGVSFGDEKRLRVMQNLDIIEQRYPKSSLRYRQFKLLDPMRDSRNRLIRQWLYDVLDSRLASPSSSMVYVTNTLPLAEHALIKHSMVFLLGQANTCTLMGNTPMEWRIQYHLPEQSLELEQDLAALDIQSLACTSQDLVASLRYLLPQHAIHFANTSRHKQRTRPWSKHRLARSQRERLIAVVGECSAFNAPVFAEMVNRLSRQDSLITLVTTEYSHFNSAAIWSSGHVFPCSFASCGFTELTDLIRQYIEWDAVLLLDDSVKAQWQAQLLDVSTAKGENLLPWIHCRPPMLLDTEQRDHLLIDQLADLT